MSEILGTEQLTIAFQPIIDLATGRMTGVEALSRFPTLPDTTPDVVFARAANAGLGLDLELLAVRRALAEARLRDLGVRLAIDDAGAGYASLRHIVTLAPDIIKIDRGLVADVHEDRARRALVMAVVGYAIEIGTTAVVGEGVETLHELEALKDLGVDAAQGYLIGRPTTDHTVWFSWAGDTLPSVT